MAQASKIQWTDATWNPTRGCSRVSEGCRNCYAEHQAARFAGFDIGPAEFTARKEGGDLPPFFGFVSEVNGHPVWTGKVELIESKLAEPLRWKNPRRIFVDSMSDLLHEELPDEALDRVFAVMALCPQHTFQALTKRAKRLLKYLAENHGFEARRRVQDILDPVSPAAERLCSKEHGYRVALSLLDGGWPLPNLWIGVSVEDQRTADERIPFLLQVPAAIRFVSYEPAIAPVDFTRLYGKVTIAGAEDLCVDALSGKYAAAWRGRNTIPDRRLSERGAANLDWVIVGGESGPGARPFDIEWARSALRQCKAAGVPCFVKQLGRLPSGSGFPRDMDYRKRDRKGGNMAEWPEDLRVREYPIAGARKAIAGAV